MADELNDDEQRLLTIIASQDSTILSLDWLAKKSDRSREAVEEVLLSLEEKGYIRLKRIEDAILPSELSAQNKLLIVASKTMRTMEQIEKLWKTRKQTDRKVYEKLRSELLENLDIYVPQLEETTIKLEKYLEKLDSKIREVQDKITETKLGLQIDYIDEIEAQRLLESYDREHKDLLERRRNILSIFMDASTIEAQRKMLEEKKDSLKYEVEVLNTKRLIGVIDDGEYEIKVAKLDQKTKRIERSLEDHAGFNIEDVFGRLENMGKTKAIPKKLHERVLKQFNMIRLLR